MRKVTGHPEIPAADASWVPQLRYTWLILRDGGYISASRKLVCPADENLGRLRDQFMDGGKQGDPWLQRVYPNGQVDTSLAAYASTYELVPAAWSPYGGTKVAEGWMPTVEQGNTEVEFLVPDTFPFGRTTVMLYDVVTPEHKVWMYDPIGRHNAGARRSYADRRSKQPLLMFDASCRIKSPAEANPGCSPNAPDSSVPCTFRGTEGDSRWTDGSEGKRLTGYFRWTRQGLRGVDIEGAEPKALVPQARKAIGDTFVRATALPATR
jgi:hypothetical protein